MTPTLSAIHIYPVKSLRGLSQQSAEVEARGLRHDRRWMVVDDQGIFLSQRECPAMARVSATVSDDSLCLQAAGRPPFLVPLSRPAGPPVAVRVWRSICEAQPIGSDADEWLTETLERPCRLVFMPETSERLVNPDYAVHPGGDPVSFADGYPLLLIGESSLTDLNSRQMEPVPMDRFRPNLVVDGSPPFAEDDWIRVRIGTSLFHGVKPCDRCAITTIDQQTGARGLEPLRTLATYRRRDGKVLFGRYLIPEGTGRVQIGDRVEVLEKSDRAS